MNLATEVLIVGAGPVGLGLAIELGHRGVKCLVVEKNDRVGYAPRAKTTNLRTREHMRRWGIADTLRDASPFGIEYPPNVVFATRLSGRLLHRFENALGCRPLKHPYYSEHSQWIPQYTVEEVMRAHAVTLPGVEVRFQTELLEFAQDADNVHTQVRDLTTGAVTTIDSRYLVGADGSRSRVREAIGATMQGVRGLSRNYNIVFRAPGLAEAHNLGPAIMYWLVNGEQPCIVGPMDRGDKWFYMPTQVKADKKLTDFESASLIARSIGIQRDFEILSSDEWTASRLIADRYRDRRVFLAGDACHLHPPFGGYGMNMGVADAVDLGWKIAATLQGWGGEALLASYEPERRPVHQYVMDEAVANHSVLSNDLFVPGLDDDGPEGDRLRATAGERVREAKQREFYTLGVTLGYRYDDSPIIVSDGSEPPPRHYRDYVPSAHPGCRAPHAWLADGSSLFDHFGWGYTLLAAPDADSGEVAAVMREAGARGLPLKVVRPPAEVAALYGARYTLVRPDQHVGWRGDRVPDSPGELLGRLTGAAAGSSNGAPRRSQEEHMSKIVERQDRRPGVLGVHSLERFVISVPNVEDAVKFYTAFGLDPRVEGNRVDLYAHGHPHCWGSVYANGQPKKLQYVSFGCYADDYDKFRERIAKLGIGCEPHPLSDGSGIWLKDPDGTPTQIVVAAKVAPSDKAVPTPRAEVAPGRGAAPPRSRAQPTRPRRLSHMLRFTPDVLGMIKFNEDVLGMRMSDRAGDLVAFLHGVHGSDHHLIAFVKSDAPGYHHSSWDVGSVDEVGWGMETMRAAGYSKGWGVGRHVLGSNYFYYAQDPWGSFAEFSYDIDHVPATLDWHSGDHPADDSFFYWGPDVPVYFVENTESPAHLSRAA